MAHSRKSPPLPPGLDPELRAALRSKHAAIRRGAFRTLGLAADGGDPVAIETLRALDDLRPPPAPPLPVTDTRPAKPTRRRVLLSAGVVTVVIAALAIVLVKLLGGTDGTRAGGSTTPAPTTSSPSAATPDTSTSAPASRTTDDGAALKWVTVRVYNNAVVSGLGARAANDIRAKGWNVTEVGNYSQGVLATTTAYYRAGTDEEPAAKALAAELGIQSEPRFPGIENLGPGVLVIVTKDYYGRS